MTSSRSTVLLIVLLVMSVALGFSLYTNHAWEDYFITFRSSKNLATGHGLVFTRGGERVHSFTSPLGVLLPALASKLTGAKSDAAALWVFRAMSLAALAGAAVLLFGAMRRLAATGPAAWITLGFVVLEAKIVDFSTNGMETGFLLLFGAYAFWSLVRADAAQWIHTGVAWAGIMWTRPDGFIYIGLLGGGYALFSHFALGGKDRARVWRMLVQAGLLTTVLYLPWFLWAWHYYGSPIPHTIVAKSSMNPGRSLPGFLQAFTTLPVRLWSGSTSVEGSLMPTYYQPAGWSPVFHWTARIMGALAMVAWLWPRLRPEIRAASLAFHGTHAYLTYFPYYPFPWYFPFTTFLGAIVWGGLVGAGWNAGDGSRAPAWRRTLLLAATGWVLAIELVLTGAAARQMAAKQRLVYEGNLQRIGRWLHDRALPGDRVFVEPLGYIGYFSQLRTYDFPGLSSPTMVAARKKANNWSGLLRLLTPEWAVLRGSEREQIEREAPGLLAELYEPAEVFDVRPQVAAARVPDRFMLQFDANFTVWHRRRPVMRDDLVESVQHRYGTEAPPLVIDHQPMRVVHAPGTMTMRIPPGSGRVEIRYGFNPDAYQGNNRTDGATFRLRWVKGDRSQLLFERTLDPLQRVEDRGLLKFAGPLPEEAGDSDRLLLETDCGPADNWDWTCWGGLVFRRAKD